MLRRRSRAWSSPGGVTSTRATTKSVPVISITGLPEIPTTGRHLLDPAAQFRPGHSSLLDAPYCIFGTSPLVVSATRRVWVHPQGFVVLRALRLAAVPGALGRLAVRSWRYASSADPQWGATARG